MKTNVRVFVGLALMALAGVAQGQIQQVHVTESLGREIEVPEGKWIKFHLLQSTEGAIITSNGRLGNVGGTKIIGIIGSAPPIRDLVLPIIDDAGPLWFSRGINATFEFIDPPGTEGLKKPSTAVVIPADEGGDVEIIMESSTDMVTWTEALPGTYGTDTAKRFFRLRAVRVAAKK